jgi:hypothetical protein
MLGRALQGTENFAVFPVKPVQKRSCHGTGMLVKDYLRIHYKGKSLEQ